MRLRNFEVDNKPLKVIEDATLLKNERCIVETSKGTLALPLLFDDRVQGYVFHGVGGLIVDSIVETTRGAVGKPTVKDLNHPFLMLGKAEEIKDILRPADNSDLQNAGYEEVDAFVEKAKELCEDLLDGRQIHGDFDGEGSRLFVFKNDEGDSDILVAKNHKIVFKSGKKVYVSKGSKSILQRPGEIIVSKKGKTVVIANDDILIERQTSTKGQ